MTDDSDINFIPGYIIEKDGCIETSSDDENSDVALAYADEPLADEAWLADYVISKRKKACTLLQKRYIKWFCGL